MWGSDDEQTQDGAFGSYESVLEGGKHQSFKDLEESLLVDVLGRDKDRRHAVLIVPAFLKGRSRQDLDRALQFVTRRLQHIVDEEYVVFFCVAKCNWLVDLPFAWMRRWHGLLPRQQRKNMKALYVVHPGLATKSFFLAMTPFVSQKFWSKLHYVENLKDIIGTLELPQGTLGVSLFPYAVQMENAQRNTEQMPPFFGNKLTDLCGYTGCNTRGFSHIPEVLMRLVYRMESQDVLTVKDMLHVQADAHALYAFVGDLESGEPAADWDNIPVVVTAFRVFLDSLPTPLLGPTAFRRLQQTTEAAGAGIARVSRAKCVAALKELVAALSDCEREVLKFLLTYFRLVFTRQRSNLMNAKKVADCLGGAFCRPPLPMDELKKPQWPDMLTVASDCVAILLEESAEIFGQQGVGGAAAAAAAAAPAAAAKPKGIEPAVSSEEEEESSEEEEDDSEEEEEESDEDEAAAAAKPKAASKAAAGPSAASGKRKPEADKKKAEAVKAVGKAVAKEESEEEESEEEESDDEEDDDDEEEEESEEEE